MSNVIYANLRKSSPSPIGTLYQHDYGQKLVFTNANLPDTYEVHFANVNSATSVTMIGDETGVAIPDAMLTSGEDISVWIYLHTGNSDGETEYHVTIGVLKRAQPTHDQPTPVQQSELEQLMARLETLIAGVPKIDDSAGIGDTDKVWSADKVMTYINNATQSVPVEGASF